MSTVLRNLPKVQVDLEDLFPIGPAQRSDSYVLSKFAEAAQQAGWTEDQIGSVLIEAVREKAKKSNWNYERFCDAIGKHCVGYIMSFPHEIPSVTGNIIPKKLPKVEIDVDALFGPGPGPSEAYILDKFAKAARFAGWTEEQIGSVLIEAVEKWAEKCPWNYEKFCDAIGRHCEGYIMSLPETPMR